MHGVFYFFAFIIIRILIYDLKNIRFRKFYNDNKPSELFDSGFNLIPILNYNFLDDILVVLPLFLCIYYKIDFSEFLFMLTIIYVLREITTSITLLPPTPQCFERNRNKMVTFELITKVSGTCNETIFSGHTSLMLLAFLFVLPKIKSNVFKIIIYIYALLTSFVIISLRSHYSIDVIVAWVICILFYVSYFGNKIVKKLIIN
jgi:hypothetical protein